MSEFCPECGDCHPDSQPCADAAAQVRRLERLKRAEVKAMEDLVRVQQQQQEFISFPRIGASLLPSVAASNPMAPAEYIASRCCDIVDAFAKEATLRWPVPAKDPGVSNG